MIAALLLGMLAAVGTPSPSADTNRPRIVALGDSLTSGRGIGASQAYPAILQERLKDSGYDVDVVNAGISGDTSGRALRRLAAALRGDVRILIVALGANDGLRGVPVEQVKSNLASIISTARARGIVVLLCGMDALPLYGWDYTVAFHKAFSELASRFDVPLVPFMLAGVIGNPSMMQRDHAHPNADGARQIADNIWPYLLPLVEKTPALTR